MPGLTISASYGAGGSVVAPRLAERLGWSFVDRTLTSAVAERLQLPVADVEAGGAAPSRLTRFLTSLAPMAAPLPPEAAAVEEEAAVREAVEEELRAAVRGGAVVLGRAGACALRDEPGVLRVRLHGPLEARIAQAARVEGVDADTARRRAPAVDRARAAYVHRLYGCGIDDPALYHLQLDSTALPLQACVELVLAAWTAFAAGASGAVPGAVPGAGAPGRDVAS